MILTIQNFLEDQITTPLFGQKHLVLDIKKMLEFLIGNIYVVYVFQQSVRIPMSTNCAPLLVDLFFFSYEVAFILKIVREEINH